MIASVKWELAWSAFAATPGALVSILFELFLAVLRDKPASFAMAWQKSLLRSFRLLTLPYIDTYL